MDTNGHSQDLKLKSKVRLFIMSYQETNKTYKMAEEEHFQGEFDVDTLITDSRRENFQPQLLDIHGYSFLHSFALLDEESASDPRVARILHIK